EGRNPLIGDEGLCYTGRLEWLPLGAFANNGDYSEGDLEMEPRPKLSLGAAYCYNHKARRTAGQLGQELYAPVDIGTLIGDAMLKCQGWALLAEWFDRRSPSPITTDPQGLVRFVTTGTGLSAQVSKYWRSRFELALRYAAAQPRGEVGALRSMADEVIAGATRYLNAHRVKLQAQLGYRWLAGRPAITAPGNGWTALFQVELGI
ncbi:MAG: hypothetical protein ACK4L7_10205, partial [Flavobacteriales bacterium]